MSHAYVSNLMHCTFSTKNRKPMIDPVLEERLWPYIGGIARENTNEAPSHRWHGTAPSARMMVVAPRGMMSFAKAVQLIKGGSSMGARHVPQYEVSNGKKDTERSAYLCHRWIRRSPMLRIRKSTTARRRSTRSSESY